MSRVAFVLVLATTAATATTSADPDIALTARADRPQIALAVNPPVRWANGEALAGSIYVGFHRHHAIRANVARWDNHDDAFGTLIGDAFFGGDGSDATESGRYLDGGIGYMYFPRKLWSGPSLEAGFLVRNQHTRVEDDFAPLGIVETHTTTLAGRALAGWSWLVYGHAFISVAVGVSHGYETGRETTSRQTFMPVYETHHVSGSKTAGEGFLRIGGAFDL